jgi:hypothetical protein
MSRLKKRTKDYPAGREATFRIPIHPRGAPRKSKAGRKKHEAAVSGGFRLASAGLRD